jgi:hypothetical protein
MREVDFVVMRRRIGAMVETEFAIVALVHDPPMVGVRQLGHVSLIVIDPTEQRIERGTKIKTPAAAVADFIDPQRFFEES